MNTAVRHVATLVLMLLALSLIGGLGFLVWNYPQQVLKIAYVTIGACCALGLLAIIYRLIFKALEDVNITKR